MVHYATPTLVQYGSRWIYHFPTPRRLTIRCSQGSTWRVETQTLKGAGFVGNATECELTTNKLRTIPELHGGTRFDMETPLV
jgi:hypothetical protein